MYHVSNRLRFDSFFTFIHSFENGYFTKILKWLWYGTITKWTIYKQNFRRARMFYEMFSKGVLKNFSNFTAKYLCRIKCEPKSLVHLCSLHLHYINDSCTQLFFSEFYRIFKNTFSLKHSWASAFDFIFDIFKSNKYMKVGFLLTNFYRKKLNKAKNPIDFKTGKS